MEVAPLSPLRFAPLFRPAPWGGRRLGSLLRQPLPVGPIGEAWVLSDQGEQHSTVADGPLEGMTLRELLQTSAPRLLGRPLVADERFPLLLKFLDTTAPLSVQVHPDDEQAAPHQSLGKTEAWVVLRSEADSQIYAGLRPDTTPEAIRAALTGPSLADHLHQFRPDPGDCVHLPAGTVHALGKGLTVFEIQQTSDLTYRLHDWNRVDTASGKPRTLHVDRALACTDFSRGPVEPVRPLFEKAGGSRRERLVTCPLFSLWRWTGTYPFTAGQKGKCRVLVGLEGSLNVLHGESVHTVEAGDVLLLPAEVGACFCMPSQAGRPFCVLECGVPDQPQVRREAA